MKKLNFSYPEFSEAFKLLNTFSTLSYDQMPCPLFEKEKEDEYYVCKHLPNIQLKLEEKSFKKYKGVVLEINDLLNQKVLKSKFIKADFDIYDNKKGYIDFKNYSLKYICDLYPNFIGKTVSSFHYCSFNKVNKNGVLDLTISPDIDNGKLRVGMFGACDLNKKSFKSYNMAFALQKEYENLWKEDFRKPKKYLKI